ncbi:MAG: hypothetical protein AAF196_19240 [Planctomycetota bacterium]
MLSQHTPSSKRRSVLRGLCASLLTTLGLALSAPAQMTDLAEDQSYEEALREYRGFVDRPSLYKRMWGRELLAATRDPRALEVLMKTYRKPEEPQQVNKYLITSLVMRVWGNDLSLATLGDWRGQNKKTTDSWLWYKTLLPTAVKHFEVIFDIARDNRDPFLRAAAMQSLADQLANSNSPDELPEFLSEMLTELPKKELERALRIEGVTAILLAMKPVLREDPWKEICRTLILQFDDEDTPQRTKVNIARMLTEAFEVPNLGLSSRWWQSELDRNPNRVNRQGPTQTVPFFSLRTIGYRFVYVIDASDSMLVPVTDREKKDLGPITGGDKPEPGEPGFVPGEDDIEWSRVVNRFDAAQEYLRLSLQSLSPEHEFAVVLFGSEAELLESTPRMIRATPANVRRVLKELQEIEPGPVVDRRPHGTLRGDTNLYGGLRMAFQITAKGETRSESYIDKKALFNGCDTIFLLSDGAPNFDDFLERDTPDPGDQAGDNETGEKLENTEFLNYQGPYVHGLQLYQLDDLRRMNLFRRAELHCVGIGEANHQLLEAMAEIGHGQAVKVEGTRGR